MIRVKREISLFKKYYQTKLILIEKKNKIYKKTIKPF